MFEGPFGKRNLLQIKELSKINPSRFYVENIRSLYDISTKNAVYLCESAVRDGFINKKVGIECPNDERIIRSFSANEQIPDTIVCDMCEAEGNDCEFSSAKCKHVEFYELVSDEI